MNCCSVLNKINYPEFIDLINKHDFICLSETKTDDFDTIEVPGYKFMMKNRKQNSRVKSGGIAFGFKTELEKYVLPIETPSKLVYWVKISKQLFNISEDIIIGNIYVPPENSIYRVEDAISELERELLNFSVNHKYILLNGDFNSRTGADKDFVELDENENCPVDLPHLDYASTLTQFDMLYKRNSNDISKNNYGNKLLDLCRNNNLFILNGRVNGDKHGLFTCRQASVVDYFICTYELISFVVTLNVLDFSMLYSDVHCPVVLKMMFKDSSIENDDVCGGDNFDNSKKIKKWDVNKKNDFVQNINLQKVEQLLHDISQVNEADSSQQTVDEFIDSFNSIIVESAENVFGTYTFTKKKNKGVKKENKPWFTQDCWIKRKAFRIAKRRYRNSKNLGNKERLDMTEKVYKREMNRAINTHKKEMRKKIDNLRKGNTKEYWNLINNRQSRSNGSNTYISIETLHDFFKDLNSGNEHEEENVTIPDVQPEQLNDLINCDFTESEILKCIKALKNDKASGDDYIVNEYIKNTYQILMPIYLKLFNLIFSTGNVPKIWLSGNILPFYKNKGEKNDPKNYRPITILSCLGKLFTSIINNRLCSFLETFLLLNENQFGFRKGYSTTDSIYVLHLLFDLLKMKKKKLYCAFIDFAKAFDTVWRPGLWRKLLEHSINGKMLTVIINMYSNIKSRVCYGSEFSDFFPCNVGVRQGESLSPVLFSLYLNDLNSFFESKNIEGLKNISNDLEDEFDNFLKLFTILYADDTVLLAESKEDLQKQLDNLYTFCELWKLKVNIDKTKIVIFSRGRLPDNLSFRYDNIVLEIVNEFNYLGLTLARSGSFLTAKKANIKKATTAMYGIIKKGRFHNLSIECQLQLFDKIVQPILLYGCEIWGAGDNRIVERVHLKFCKLLLHLKSSTPDYMVYGELGRYPLDISIKLRMINYWSKMLSGKPEKLPLVLYKLCLRKYILGSHMIWLSSIKNILDSCGLSYIWDTQNFISPSWLYSSVKQCIIDQFNQEWISYVQNSPKALNYRLFKENFEFENYLNVLDHKKAINMCRFRTTNHNLPIEVGRWRNINRNERKCILCNSDDIGDEFHYLFTCSAFKNERSKFIKYHFRTHPNILKMRDLMQTTNILELNNLCKFVEIVIKKLNSPG